MSANDFWEIPVRIFARKKLETLPCNDLKDIVASHPVVSQVQRGHSLNIRGGGEDGTLYVVDGMMLMR